MLCYIASMVEIPDDFDDKVTETLKIWVENHPNPDEVALGGAMNYTARQIAEEVANRTAFGLKHLEVIRFYLEQNPEVTVEELLRDISGVSSRRESPSKSG